MGGKTPEEILEIPHQLLRRHRIGFPSIQAAPRTTNKLTKWVAQPLKGRKRAKFLCPAATVIQHRLWALGSSLAVYDICAVDSFLKDPRPWQVQ